MAHWTEAYLGRPWIKDEYDCADLVRDVALDRLGIDVVLPSERQWRRLRPERIAEMGASWAMPAPVPAEHDVVLMRLWGGRGWLGSHIGIAAIVGARPWVLHNIEGAGVVFNPIAAIARVHLRLEGYYRWI